MNKLPPPGGVLALDLAPSFVGWAYGAPEDRIPVCGHWRLPKIGGEGARYAAFTNALYPTLDLIRPSQFVIEKALPLSAQTDMVTTRNQLGLRAFVVEAGHRKSIALMEIDVWTVRIEVFGRAAVPGPKGQIKIEITAFIRSLGIDAIDHNAADAAMVWLWYSRQARGIPPAAGPLFRERAHA